MRCADVIEELAAPGSSDPAALAEHLAGCPRCAARARQGARLDRLWEATRPEEPSPSAWATVWARVNRSLDAAEPMDPPSRLRRPAVAQPHPWRRRALATFAIAQAAVLLVAAWLVSRPDPGRPAPRGAQAETGLAVRPPDSRPKPTEPAPVLEPAPAPIMVTVTVTPGAEIKIDDGELVLIQSGPQGVTVVSHRTDETSGAVDGTFVGLNELEARAE